MKKSDLSMLIWGFHTRGPNQSMLFLSSKRKIWFWRPKSISPRKTSQTCQQKEKGPYPHYYSQISTSFGGKRKRHSMTCTNTIKNPNIHNPLKRGLKSTTDPHNIHSAKWEKQYISKAVFGLCKIVSENKYFSEMLFSGKENIFKCLVAFQKMLWKIFSSVWLCY